MPLVRARGPLDRDASHAHRRAAGGRARRRARRRRRAPRRQAAEHPDRRRRPRVPDGLRAGARRRAPRRPHRHRRVRGTLAYIAPEQTEPGAAHRRTRRPVRTGLQPLRGARRIAPFVEETDLQLVAAHRSFAPRRASPASRPTPRHSTSRCCARWPRRPRAVREPLRSWPRRSTPPSQGASCATRRPADGRARTGRRSAATTTSPASRSCSRAPRRDAHRRRRHGQDDARTRRSAPRRGGVSRRRRTRRRWRRSATTR